MIKEALSGKASWIPDMPHAYKTNSNTEKILLKLWLQTLKLDSLNIEDNFFEVGGHSILIPQILINLKKQQNIDLQITHMFQYPTIKSLASFIDGARDNHHLKTTHKLARNHKIAIQQHKKKVAIARMRSKRT
jgi:acyl carrier protein